MNSAPNNYSHFTSILLAEGPRRFLDDHGKTNAAGLNMYFYL